SIRLNSYIAFMEQQIALVPFTVKTFPAINSFTITKRTSFLIY
ncbi:MAG: hypothetical protein ACI83B_004025, partial [Sediminicola sp.]